MVFHMLFSTVVVVFVVVIVAGSTESLKTIPSTSDKKKSEAEVKRREEGGGRPVKRKTTLSTSDKKSEAEVKRSEEGGGRPGKRRRPTCPCDCQDGIIRLDGGPENVARADDDPEQRIYRCTCSLCCPLLGDGTRQCQIELNQVGAAISRSVDGQLICFDCRGYD